MVNYPWRCSEHCHGLTLHSSTGASQADRAEDDAFSDQLRPKAGLLLVDVPNRSSAPHRVDGDGVRVMRIARFGYEAEPLARAQVGLPSSLCVVPLTAEVGHVETGVYQSPIGWSDE
jgi:hypothetical protein